MVDACASSVRPNFKVDGVSADFTVAGFARQVRAALKA